jgi:hypothetical protein
MLNATRDAPLGFVGTAYNLSNDVSNGACLSSWKTYAWVGECIAVIVVVWFTRGGFADLKDMISSPRSVKRERK